ncbi:ABC transporter permease subunit [Inconstantimicrobium mannanitabidum]|uniref:ABC transporter permease n=1 Tax=Inconstantimicrobium mannanitabidum TaxID=1604901 RepID=A0ACB5RGX7_9CLOT|nr:ABC transporter permease subunit [Clostridium sp. TW13]GKX68351.1 ABC transporter permease [Clostridium sp. TW13]
MLFILIKNELIKILRRGKTWVVFILFIALVGLAMYGSFYDEKQQQKYNNPQNRLQDVNYRLSDVDKEIKDLESSKSSENEDKLNSLKMQQQTLTKEKEKWEALANGTITVEQIKASRDQEIKTLEQQIKENKEPEEKVYTQQRIQTIKYLQANNLKDEDEFKVNPYSFMKTLFEMLGTMLLVAGIAVFMSDIVSGECTPPTLKFLLLQPISRGKVLLSKFIAVVVTVISMIMSIELVGFLVIGIVRGFNFAKYPALMGTQYKMQYAGPNNSNYQPVAIDGTTVIGTNADLILKSFLLQILFIITCCAFVFLISTLFKSSMITMAISVLFIIGLTIFSHLINFMKQIAHLLFISYGNPVATITGNVVLDYKNVNMTVTTAIIVMIVTTVVSYLIAHIIFKKKDILI